MHRLLGTFAFRVQLRDGKGVGRGLVRVWKLDRLGRSLRDLIEIVARLEGDGIQFISLTEDINTKTAAGRLIFHVFAILAELERNLIRERTMAGLASARARGRLGAAKKKTTAQQDKQLRALWDNDKFTAAQIAEQFGISLPTFFRRVKMKSFKAPSPKGK